MRILYIDIDTCRPDHLGCYGYHRNTSPNIDALAKNATIFNNCYVSDSPCLPSRTALFWGQFGYRTGIVNHGGKQSQMNIENRGFSVKAENTTLAQMIRMAGYETCSVSSFMDRHGAWHVTQGWGEILDDGEHGHETAEQVNELALPWLERNAKKDKWFMHLNYWDPHRPHRTPASYGNQFKNDPPPSWPDQQTLDRQNKLYGPVSASNPLLSVGYHVFPEPWNVERLNTTQDFKRWIDGYDTAIHYVDYHIGQVMQSLEKAGVLDDTMIIISADHGESEGEFNVYGEHMTADQSINHVPLIVRWPGVTKGSRRDELIYQFDLASTLCEITGARIPKMWDSKSFAPALKGEAWQGRPYLVLGHGAHTVQRSVRTEDWLMMRTYHPGLKEFPEVMLFDVKKDPHETTDLASQKPEVVQKCNALMYEWTQQFYKGKQSCQDPFVQVLKEGGPHHSKNFVERYVKHLREMGLNDAAEAVLKNHA